MTAALPEQALLPSVEVPTHVHRPRTDNAADDPPLNSHPPPGMALPK